MDEEYLKAVKNIHYWQYGQNPDNFTSLLLSLFQKADAGNMARLGMAFPTLFAAYSEWRYSESEEQFFRKYGLPEFYEYLQKKPDAPVDHSGFKTYPRCTIHGRNEDPNCHACSIAETVVPEKK